jgi:ABC-2 type transport system permease protein
MTAPSVPVPSVATPGDAPATARSERSVPGAGWMIIGAKEFGDHLLSGRFIVLLIVLALAVSVPLYFLGGQIRDAAEGAAQFPALFLGLFWVAPSINEDITLPSVVGFLAIVGPLLGLAFSFDAINGERANGTLPRLLSQPIHRDDVVNGKFVAGLAVIGLVLLCAIGAIAAFGLIRLGIVPDASELLRAVVWVFVTFSYVSFWLAFGMLLSVAIRRAATSALVGFGVWVLLTFFGRFIVSLVAGVVAPIGGTSEEQVSAIGAQQTLFRLLPDTLYREASLVLLNPQSSAANSVSAPSTIGGYEQAQQQVASLLSLDQSFIFIWPQVVGLFALTVACFALAYVMFMRQEVRA